MKIRVGIFFGGKTVEHEVSIISAMQAIAVLDTEKYEVIPVYIGKNNLFYTGEHLKSIEAFRDISAAISRAQRVLCIPGDRGAQLIMYPQRRFKSSLVSELDVALPIVHGTNVEDGALQGFLEYLGIPYCGCNVAASAAGMDKWAMKALFMAAGIPVSPAARLTSKQFYENGEQACEFVEGVSRYPIIVKPSNLGSSVGIGKAANRAQLVQKITDAFSFAPVVLCEQAVENLREINVSVLGDRDGVCSSVCEEPLNATDVLTYKDKYQASSPSKGGQKNGAQGMASLTRSIPANIPRELTEQAKALAEEAFLAIDASGVARVDLLLDDKAQKLYVNEINTIPGSLSFYLWEHSGLSFSDMLEQVISLALKRSRELEGLSFSFETNLLSGVMLGSKGSKQG